MAALGKTVFFVLSRTPHAGFNEPYLWSIGNCLKIQRFAKSAPDTADGRWRCFKRLYGFNIMTHVVTDACIRCKYTDCVDVCPVDCFREGPNFLLIDPDECIDCAVCVPECPVNAIFAEEDVPADQQQFIAINAQLARTLPVITRSKDPLPDADEWKDAKDKLRFMEK